MSKEMNEYKLLATFHLQKEKDNFMVSKHKFYKRWKNMMERCNNPKHPWYHKYGGRGIFVCPKWKNSKAFIYDVSALPNSGRRGYSIDRINNNKGYSPDNVKWSTRHEQQINRGIPKSNTSGVVGVHFNKRAGKWRAVIMIMGVRKVRYFKEKKDAINQRREWELFEISQFESITGLKRK